MRLWSPLPEKTRLGFFLLAALSQMPKGRFLIPLPLSLSLSLFHPCKLMHTQTLIVALPCALTLCLYHTHTHTHTHTRTHFDSCSLSLALFLYLSSSGNLNRSEIFSYFLRWHNISDLRQSGGSSVHKWRFQCYGAALKSVNTMFNTETWESFRLQVD